MDVNFLLKKYFYTYIVDKTTVVKCIVSPLHFIAGEWSKI